MKVEKIEGYPPQYKLVNNDSGEVIGYLKLSIENIFTCTGIATMFSHRESKEFLIIKMWQLYLVGRRGTLEVRQFTRYHDAVGKGIYLGDLVSDPRGPYSKENNWTIGGGADGSMLIGRNLIDDSRDIYVEDQSCIERMRVVNPKWWEPGRARYGGR